MSQVIQLRCAACGRCDKCRLPDLVDKLRAVGKLRRAEDPEWDLIVELMKSSANSLRCEGCGQIGLLVESADDDDDWPDARACEKCGKLIPLERLEVFPDAQLCAACQSADDSGDGEEREFCPRCGGLMQVRAAGGAGVARFELVCQDCGKRS